MSKLNWREVTPHRFTTEAGLLNLTVGHHVTLTPNRWRLEVGNMFFLDTGPDLSPGEAQLLCEAHAVIILERALGAL